MQAFRVVAFALMSAVAVVAQPPRVFYDYVENGALRGGRFVMDPNDAEQRHMFGLDGAVYVAGVWAFESIIDNGPSENRVDVVILGDGYTEGELALYANDVDTVISSFFSGEPFAAYAPYFNVHRVDVVSAESGVDEIDLGIFKNTALGMAYGCFGIDRLLCINVGAAWAAAGSAPQTDQILALANSTRYGGAGYPDNDLGTLAGRNSSAIEIALHEFGHSFADLADEYDYGGPIVYTGPEPVEPNLSIYTSATLAAQERKWFRWLDLGNVDTFEGGGYSEQGIYRPTFNSKMRSLNRPFEQVNVEQLVVSAYKSVSPIDEATPVSAEPYSACETFFVVPMAPVGHALDVQWSIDGAPVPGAVGQSFEVDPSGLSAGLHTVGVAVVDNTTRVRDESLRAQWLTDSRAWTIEALGVADECLCPPPDPLAVDPDGVPKSRYVSVVVPPPGLGQDATDQALRIRAVDLGVFGGLNGETWWVGAPESVDDPAAPLGSFAAARLQCAPHFMDWAAVGTVHVYGPEIVPGATYDVERVDACCPSLDDPSCYSAAVGVATGTWGDAVGPFGGGSQPNFADVTALVNKFANESAPVLTYQVDLVPDVLNHTVNFADITADVEAFKGLAYPYAGPAGCP